MANNETIKLTVELNKEDIAILFCNLKVNTADASVVNADDELATLLGKIYYQLVKKFCELRIKDVEEKFSSK